VGRVSDVVRERLQTTVVGELALRLANQVIHACSERGIVLMPLKGVLLLGRWPSLVGRRDLVDIDLLVRSSDNARTAQVLSKLGFEASVGSSVAITFVSDAWPLSIDLHQELFPHGLFRAGAEGVFSRAELDSSLFSAPVARMADEDLFAHLIGHFVKGRGRFAEDKSLSDLRWLLKQGIFGLEDAGRLGAHLRELGLLRAAGYVLGHESFRDEPVALATLRALELSRRDRAAIAAVRLDTRLNEDTPRWWTPHLLDRSLAAGSCSLLAHADEGLRRLVARLTAQAGSLSMRRS
jgi:hypothetical protein